MKNKGCIVLVIVGLIILIGIRLNIKKNEIIDKSITETETNSELVTHDKKEDSIGKAKRLKYEKENSRVCINCSKHYLATSYTRSLKTGSGMDINVCSQQCVDELNREADEMYENAKNGVYNARMEKSGGQNKLQEQLDNEDSNPNRTTCPQCNGRGYETGGVVNGQREEMICRLCKGTGKGHY